MDCFRCTIVSGEPVPTEAEAICWLRAEDLNELNWLPADRIILPEIEKILR